MPNLLDNLTYSDLSGKRKFRRYVIAAMLIAFLIGLMFIFSQFQHSQAMSEVFAPPKVVTSEPGLETMLASPQTLEPTPTGCPNDPEGWILEDTFPGDNLKRITPICVYEGLARTVAWHMLERMGYSKPEAKEMLAFDELPYEPLETIRMMTSLKGPLELQVSMEWGPHPAYRYWTLDEDGNPGMVYTLQGCYRARTVVGNQAENWGPYPIHCLVALDYTPGWTVHELGEYRYTAHWADQPGARAFVLFAYTGEGQWSVIGELPDLYIPHDNMGSDLVGNREATAARHGLSVWDALWLVETYGFPPHPLKEGWQLMTDPDALQPMGQELNLYAEVP